MRKSGAECGLCSLFQSVCLRHAEVYFSQSVIMDRKYRLQKAILGEGENQRNT